MGKKKSEVNRDGVVEPPKEGHNLLGCPTFEQLENGRFRCVETGHELPAECRDSYSQAKHCRLGLIDWALARKKPPLNMFKQDPSSRSKLTCKLTGDTINKSEEHIWKHMTGKRFLNMLDKKESEKETPNASVVEKESEGKHKKKKKKEDVSSKKNKKPVAKEDINIEDIISEVRDSTEKSSSDLDDEVDFWMPPAGERWDQDNGGDRWGSESESDGMREEEEEAGAEETEAGKLSKQTKRMSLEIGPSNFASRKKKMKKDVA